MSKFFAYLLIFGVVVAITFAIQNDPEPILRDNRDAENVSEVIVIEEVTITEIKDETQRVTEEKANASTESDPSEKAQDGEDVSQEVAGDFAEVASEEEDVETAPLTIDECQAQIDKNSFYWESQMQAVKKETELRESNNNEDADLLRAISCTPQAVWIFGDNKELAIEKLQRAVAKSTSDGKIPVLVIYNAPQHSSLNWGSGVGNGNAYLAWITTIAETIGVSDAWVILEPDAIPLSHNLTSQSRVVRLGEIRGAVEILKEQAPNVTIYLDAGHNVWKIPERISEYLITAGIEEADGFSLNVSNYQLTSDEIKYGKEISDLTGGKHFIIDTSRNGKGPAGPYDWCNALGRAIGETPTVETNETLVDAFLWVKPPGESDGSCNGGPTPGKFWLDYTLDLIKEAA